MLRMYRESFAPGGSHRYLGVNVRGVTNASAPLTGSHSRQGVSDWESLTTGVTHAYDTGYIPSLAKRCFSVSLPRTVVSLDLYFALWPPNVTN